MGVNSKILTSGTTKWGYGQAEYNPPLGTAMAGHSLTGQVGNSKDADAPLRMRTLVMNPAGGGEVILCFMDLLSGSGAIYNRVQELLPSPHRRIALVGSHTHYAPGKYFGNPFYDSLSQPVVSGVRLDAPIKDVIELLAKAIVESIKNARSNAKDGKMAVVRSTLWKCGANRSYGAFEKNDLAGSWNTIGMPGEDVDQSLDSLQKSIDPRVTTILAVDNDQKNVCAFSTLACHTTCMGPYEKVYSADWPGIAAKVITETLGISSPGVVYNAAFALCAAGDVSSLDLDRLKDGGGVNSGQGNALKLARGKRIGEHVAAVIQKDLPGVLSGTSGTLSITFKSDDPLSEDDQFNPQKKLGPPKPGWPLVAGVADGHGKRDHSEARDGGINRPRRTQDSRHQFPKRIVAGSLLSLLELTEDTLGVAKRHPICQIQIGKHLFMSAPCEMTTMAGYLLEKNVLEHASTTASSASVLANTNDYMGYVTTIPEYEAQRYEGGHTLFGRFSLWLLNKVHVKVLGESMSASQFDALTGDASSQAFEVADDGAETALKNSGLIEEIRKRILSTLEDSYFVQVEPPQSKSWTELDEELAGDFAEFEQNPMSGETKASQMYDLEQLENAEANDAYYEVQVLFRSEQTRKKVFLRHLGKTYDSSFVIDIGDIGDIHGIRDIGTKKRDVYAAVFELPGLPTEKEQYELQYLPNQ